MVKGGGGLGRKENKARDSSLVFERRALWACSVFISLRRQHRSSQKNISKQVSFQPSPRRRRALGCQGGFAQPPASLGYLRLSPSPSSCFCPEPAGRAQLPDKPGRVGRLRVAPAAPEPLALRTGAQFSRTKCGWHGAGGDNLPGWTLGEVSRPPPPSLLLVCSGEIAALPLPPSRLPRRPPRRRALSPLHSPALLLPPQG